MPNQKDFNYKKPFKNNTGKKSTGYYRTLRDEFFNDIKNTSKERKLIPIDEWKKRGQGKQY